MLEAVFQMMENHHLECDGQGNHVDKIWEILPFVINTKSFTKLDTEDLSDMDWRSHTDLSNYRFQEVN